MIEKVTTDRSVLELFGSFQKEPYCFILDSNLQNDRLGRYSFMGSNPFLILKSKDKDITLWEKGQVTKLKGDPFEVMKAQLKRYKHTLQHPLPFIGGAVGYFAYDMCHHIEKLPRKAVDDVELPDCCFCFYDSLLAVDHIENKVYAIALGIQEAAEMQIAKLLEKANKPAAASQEHAAARTCGEITSNFTKEDYKKAVQRVRDYIQRGDIYQANLTQRFSCPTEEEAFSLYQRLRKLNPAPFACFMDFGEGQLLSSSPERFVKIRERHIETRPIKGTRPRGKTPAEDEANKKELLDSEKDQSELLMIVDLERNDLGRVSKTGTVKVPELFYLEEYATVHHLVSTITGEMKEGLEEMDVIRAAFPGGSITGAPKIRAMEVIDELEPTQRNIYTGSIGYLSFNGNVDLNIAIRTMVMKNQRVYFQAGGGIVWDSDPEMEYEETLHKVSALFRALGEEK
jgi:para-aminobenzoate synthetase component 1